MAKNSQRQLNRMNTAAANAKLGDAIYDLIAQINLMRTDMTAVNAGLGAPVALTAPASIKTLDQRGPN